MTESTPLDLGTDSMTEVAWMGPSLVTVNVVVALTVSLAAILECELNKFQK